MEWNAIRHEILQMGKFPSCVWHNDELSESKKKALAVNLNDPKNMGEFVTKGMGLPLRYFDIPVPKTISKAVKKGETIPMPFIADMMITYARDRIVSPNRSIVQGKELKERVLNRALNVYMTCTECLREVRFAEMDQADCLYEMVRVWTSWKV